MSHVLKFTVYMVNTKYFNHNIEKTRYWKSEDSVIQRLKGIQGVGTLGPLRKTLSHVTRSLHLGQSDYRRQGK